MYPVFGGNQLFGTVEISGSKNAALAIMAAALLSDAPVVLDNLPLIADVFDMAAILEDLGARIQFAQNSVLIDPRCLCGTDAFSGRAQKIRASCYLLGALTKFGGGRFAAPGGCNLGGRPIDYHLDALRALGAEITEQGGVIRVDSRKKMAGAKIVLPFPSVGATVNAALAASCSDGTTLLINAACEPHVVDFFNFLSFLGVRVEGAGTPSVTVEGNHGYFIPSAERYAVISDQIEAGTFMIYTALCKGLVTLKKANPTHLESVISALARMGVLIDSVPAKGYYLPGILPTSEITAQCFGRTKAIELTAEPHPGFPTDLQPLMLALMCVSDGVSILTDTVFSGRFSVVTELLKMGAQISVIGNTAVVKGIPALRCAAVDSRDLRAAAALFGAALSAYGTSSVSGTAHIRRGYEHIDKKILLLR
ncbi:MAG: UDP-N-acetylglucosamine 1-carboxyvinyltransferase [Firmicutes bacterium]|nr:UDP-N-acetylglucosamine 1-carboxyvinyltransferase [Bacillota bacterium]